MRSKFFVVMIVAVASLAAVGSAQADLLLDYDFNSLPVNTDLAGQDGWVAQPGNIQDIAVLDRAGGGSLLRCGSAGDAYDQRAITIPTLTSADTFELQAEFRAGSREARIALVQASNDYRPFIGMSADKTFLRTATPSFVGSGDSLLDQNWYQIKLFVDLSTAGGVGTISYRNLTTGETAFTEDSILKDLPMGYAQTTPGNYNFSHMVVLCSGSDEAIGGHFMVGSPTIPIPEPSALALLTAGMVGLLAYAWEERK